jgi:quercetin dioxygenase-like cupin family protein
MDNFPDFMKHPANRIATSNESTPGVQGYVFDGADGSQMAFWTCSESAVSTPHVHDYDEYFVVLQGCYTLIIDGERISVRAGEGHFIPQGTLHPGEVVAGTRPSTLLGGAEPQGCSGLPSDLQTIQVNLLVERARLGYTTFVLGAVPKW